MMSSFIKNHPLFFSALLVTFQICMLNGFSYAGEVTSIDSDTLEHDAATSTITARGHVKIVKGLAKIEADEAIYHEKTSDVVATGSILYEDPAVIIKAGRAQLNIDKKTGRLYDAEIFSKKDNYHIKGNEIEKIAEGEYRLEEAVFTTCDAPVPAWCFKGSDVEAVMNDRLKARSVTFNIKEIPVLYSPVFSSSLSKERKTGLLMPAVGYLKSKGFHFEQPFFWAISENRDATLVLDVYSKTGVGEGLEYRYLGQDGSKGNFWIYHLYDKELGRNFLDLHGVHEGSFSDDRVKTFLNLNYISSRVFYNEYNPYILNKLKKIDAISYLNVTTNRFFESTAEASISFENSRLFLNSQYLIDLKDGSDNSKVSQRLPEAGFFMDPRRAGPFVFSLSSTISNFWREGDVKGQRLDIYPMITHSFGSSFIIKQSLGLRETSYLLSRNDEYGTSPHREAFDYSLSASTRLIKRYSSFVHIIEPSLSYTFIPNSEANLPLFDSTEMYSKTSRVVLAVQNRFIDNKGELLTFRVSQAYDSYLGDRSFMPLKFDIAVRRPVAMRGELSYDVSSGRVENLNSDLYIKISDVSLSIGERYKRSEDIMFYSVGFSYAFSRSLSAEGNFWYDARESGLRDVILKLNYKEQCWGLTTIIIKRENDYSASLLFDLLGLGTLRL